MGPSVRVIYTIFNFVHWLYTPMPFERARRTSRRPTEQVFAPCGAVHCAPAPSFVVEGEQPGGVDVITWGS